MYVHVLNLNIAPIKYLVIIYYVLHVHVHNIYKHTCTNSHTIKAIEQFISCIFRRDIILSNPLRYNINGT